MMPNVNVPLVDKAGCPTRAFVHLLAGLTGTASGSLPGQIAILQGDVNSLQALTTAQSAAISSLVSDVTTIDAQLTTLTQRVADEEIRTAFQAAGLLWP